MNESLKDKAIKETAVMHYWQKWKCAKSL